jgi:hypothetical protein
MRSVKYVKVTLVAGIALIVAVGALTLTRSPPRVVGVGTTTDARSMLPLARTLGDANVCQANEALPAGVSAIRLTLGAEYGSNVHVKAYSGSQVLTEGARGPEWTSGSVTVPVRPLSRAASHVTLCFDLSQRADLFPGKQNPR